jgi:hypothetical protein
VIHGVRFQVSTDDFGLAQNPGHPFQAWKGIDPFMADFIPIHVRTHAEAAYLQDIQYD